MKFKKMLIVCACAILLATGNVFCDISSFMKDCWDIDGVTSWNDVNSVANTGEDYQALAGISKSEIKKYFTSAEILEGYSLGKVSLDMVASLYGNDPTYWADLQNLASQSSKYEHYYKAYQGKSPSSTSSAQTSSDSKTEETTETTDTTSEKANTPSKEEVEETVDEVTEESITGLFVVIADTTVFTAPDGNELGTLEIGTEIDVLGSSKGYYQITFEEQDGYVLIDDETIIPKEDYDNAWEETERAEPTCTEDGYYTLTNSYSKLEETTTLAATGHDDGQWVTVTKAGLFTKGLEQRLCTIDNAVLEEKELAPTIPIPVVISIICGIAIIGAGAFFVVKKVRK